MTRAERPGGGAAFTSGRRAERADGLPELLGRIADEVGLGAALALARDFGGSEIYVPETVREDHPLAKALGLKDARAVARLFAREKIIVPLGPADHARQVKAAIARYLAAGKTDGQIWHALKALGLRCHIETIRRRRRAAGVGDPAQPGLLDAASPERTNDEK